MMGTLTGYWIVGHLWHPQTFKVVKTPPTSKADAGRKEQRTSLPDALAACGVLFSHFPGTKVVSSM